MWNPARLAWLLPARFGEAKDSQRDTFKERQSRAAQSVISWVAERVKGTNHVRLSSSKSSDMSNWISLTKQRRRWQLHSLLNSVRCSDWQLKLIMAVLEAFRLVQCNACAHDAFKFTSTHTHKDTKTHIQVTYTQLFSVWRSFGALHDTKLLKCFFYVRRKPRPASGGGIQCKVKGSQKYQSHWGNAKVSDLVICGARHSGKSRELEVAQCIKPEIRMHSIVQQLSESSNSSCSLFWTKIGVDMEILIIFQLDSEHISSWFDDHKKSSRWERLECCQLFLCLSFKLGDERLKQKMFDSSFFFICWSTSNNVRTS